MKKDQVLKSVVLLQAVCMIILAAVVITRVLSPGDHAPLPSDESDDVNQDPPSVMDHVAATVGEEQIASSELADQLQSQYGDTVLHTLMVRAAIRQEAKTYDLKVSNSELENEIQSMMAGYESEDQYYESMKEQLGLTPEAIKTDTEYRLLLEKIATRTIAVSDEEIEAFLEENKDQFAPHTQYRLSWIVTENKKDAQDLLDRLSDGEDFALMAKTYSIDTDTSDSGGDLGLIDEDDPFMDSGVLDEAAKLEVGEITGPIAVEKGQAVIQLTEKHTTEQLDEQTQRDNARRQLELSKADPLDQVEDELLVKYNAKIMP
ncbi:peptidylprolyl isomerase [Paenibacillus sepulcri]|uniref:peptidylprolyl isomerase n=1 Tax=Paenibacillus sepulcri TaxID=359917 RepID=A0ABS7C0G3_9BACL|nr:peptidylprolyl isomerase [Paenibacillus sepulcri]